MVYWQSKIRMNIRIGIQSKLIRSYLGAPYVFYLQRNPAEIVRSLSEDVNFASMLIMNIITLFKETFLLIIIFGLLFYAEPIISISVLLFLTISSWNKLIISTVETKSGAKIRS